MKTKSGKSPAKPQDRCFIDPKQPGIIRFRDGVDSFDGLLAGTRAKELVKVINAHENLVEALERIGRTDIERTFCGDADRFIAWLHHFVKSTLSRASV